METLWEVVEWIPAGIVVLFLCWLHFHLWRSSKVSDSEFDEEEKRQQAVKDLYPASPSYEERMGVQYGEQSGE